MAVIRVDYAALSELARVMRTVPSGLDTARQGVTAARGETSGIGDPTAAAESSELLRQLNWILEMAALTSAGLVRSVDGAARDYAGVDAAVVRFHGERRP